MRRIKLKYYVKLLNEERNNTHGSRTFATLNFPTPSVNPIEADDCLVKLLDQLRKTFEELHLISLMAFSTDAGIHFHVLFIDYGNELPPCRINRWIKSDTIDAHKNDQRWILERDVLVPKLEAKIRESWPKIIKSKSDKGSVHCCNFELESGHLIDYLVKNATEEFPREWKNIKVPPVHQWGIKNKALKSSDFKKGEVNEQYPSAKIAEIAPPDLSGGLLGAEYPLDEKASYTPEISLETAFHRERKWLEFKHTHSHVTKDPQLP